MSLTGLDSRSIPPLRLLVLGCPGSGKTVFATQLGNLFDVPVRSIDSAYWRDGWQRSPDNEWLPVLQKWTDEENWIIDGNYHAYLSGRVNRASLVVIMRAPSYLRITRLLKRSYLNAIFSLRAPPGHDQEWPPFRTFIKLLVKVYHFDRDILPQMRKSFIDNVDLPIVELTNNRDRHRFIAYLDILLSSLKADEAV